jgi:hypothetical protein
MVEKLSPSDAGTIFEGSAVRSSEELSLAVIRYAFEKGMPAHEVANAFNAQEFDLADKSAAESDDATAYEWFGDNLNDLSDVAVEWLTKNVAPDGFSFVWDDGLILMDEEYKDYGTGEEKTIEHYRSA